MIHQTKTLVTDTFNPHLNLAVEEHLLDSLQPGVCVFYLWQNAKTVVIGRNQNAYKECRAGKLIADGGSLARRLSGGGSVYHDLGNLNFTFFAHEADYDVLRQLSVIVKALGYYGIIAETTGRNDINADGRKFSGNAFYKHKGRCYHHGTILVDTDMSKMGEYLFVSAEKLRSHGVESVRSRVVNLVDLNPHVDIEGMKAALLKAFGEVYGVEPVSLRLSDPDQEAIAVLQGKYASDDWVYGKHMRADYAFGRKYPWGEVEIRFALRGETITDAQVFSDAMDAGIAEAFASRFKGVPFRVDAILEAVSAAEKEAGPYIAQDIRELVSEQDIWR